MRLIKIFLFLFFIGTFSAWSQGNYEDGEQAYLDEDYEKALSILLPLAENNHDDAQYYVGAMYHYGDGVEQNYKTALNWYVRSADLGDPDSQKKVGDFYREGWGVSQSWKKAFRWYEMTAEAGNELSQYYMGYMYENGYGVDQSYEKAAEWYQKSADQGDADAQGYLAELYENGKGVEQNYTLAVSYYLQAIGQGNEYAIAQLSNLINENAPETQAKSEAFLMVAEVYREGNVSQAVEHWRYAAEKGDSDSQTMLGVLYAEGQAGLPQDYNAAGNWYLKAAVKGNALAQYGIGSLYGNGFGVEKNLNLAKFWFQLSSDNGHEQATEALKLLE